MSRAELKWTAESRSRHQTPDEDTLRALRAASPALQEYWPDGESPPRSWKGVTWSDDRVQELDLSRSKLEVLPPQIGQLTALTKLVLVGCPLKELPPEFGLLLALTDLLLKDCTQLTLAPGATEGQAVGSEFRDFSLTRQSDQDSPAQDFVAAYARLLIVEPRKDSPGQLHAFLLANPLAVPAFFKYIVGDVTGIAIADWLGGAVKATPELGNMNAPDGRGVTFVAEEAQRRRTTAKPDEAAAWPLTLTLILTLTLTP